MLRLMRKDAGYFTNIFILLPITAVYWILTKTAIDIEMLFVAIIFTLLLTLGAVLIIEQREDKYHGYAFLRQLPIKTSDIIGAKFMQVLLAELFIVLFYLVVLGLFPGNGGALFSVGKSLIVLSGLLCLLITAVIYLGIFKFGFTVFVRFLLVCLLLLSMIPPLLLQFDTGIKPAMIIDFLTGLNMPLFILSSLLLYFILMYLTIRISLEGFEK